MGVLLEYGQRLAVERDFEVADMVADAAGVCVGIALPFPLRARLKRWAQICGENAVPELERRA